MARARAALVQYRPGGRSRPRSGPNLTYLGDLIDRGLDSARCLALVARFADEHGVAGITRLLGNHQQILRLVLDHGMPPGLWFENGGLATVDSYPHADGDYRQRLRQGLAEDTGLDLDGWLEGLVSTGAAMVWWVVLACAALSPFLFDVRTVPQRLVDAWLGMIAPAPKA